MPNIIQRLISKIRGTPPKAPTLAPGHRGIALGHGSKPTDLNRRVIASGEVAEFVYEGQPLFVNSSNVAMAQYHKDASKMMVEFLDGSAYLYSNISEAEAISFAQAQSKGIWVWSTLRVRGSKTAHRKPYQKIR